MNYNLMLIVVMVLVCTTYVLINDRTIKKFNSTYTTYNELNQFYDNLKNLNDALQVYLYSPDDQNYKDFHRYRTVLQGNVEKVKASLKNQDHVWRFELLNNMVDGYMAQAELVIASDLQQEKEFSAKYQELLYEYDLINKTASEYYGLATQDMQLQKAAVNSNQKTMQLVSLFFILYLIVWMIYFSISTIKSITDPLEKVINNMNRIKKGAYDLTQNDNLRKDELLAQSELRILQNQINPHFLFNTLNMIYKKAYSEGAYETSELMEKTSQLLRYGLDNASKISSLKKEIKAIYNYNYIQEKRYGDRIRFLMDIEEDLPDIPMPSMVLQPLVENAVSHGLQDIIEDGEVVIEVSRLNDEIMISVSDNGTGMPADELEKLILNDFRMSSDERSHLGLYNVTRRLKAFYGDGVRIIVNSLEECGFEINIQIDLKENGYV